MEPRRSDRRASDLVRIVLVGGLVLGVVATLVIPAGTLLAGAFRTDGRVANRLRPLAERSTVYAADGSVLGQLGTHNRAVIDDLDAVPRVVLDAVVAAEDRSYWDNGGVDVPAMTRALMNNVEAGDIEQGGSTIAQQLVKNRILDGRRTVERKVEELVLAYRLKHELGPRRVLLEYLNTVYFGEGSYGIAAAAERIAGKPLGELGPADAALLAGLIRSPSRTNPFDQPEVAEARRAEVLVAMVDRGSLTVAEARAATDAPLPDPAARPAAELRPRDHFVDEVQRHLLDDPRLGATPEERADRLLRGGLQIHTTLDPRLQDVAERAVRETLPPSPFTAALVAIDPRTGAVRAMVGGPSFDEAQYNLATQGARQPGSTFKIVTLATALQHGYSPEDLVDGRAGCTFSIPGQPPWSPGGTGGGMMTLRDATAQSINCAYARLIMGLGPEKVAETAQAMGVTGRVPAVPSMTLGSVEASPLEMASVTATIAADGVRHAPVFVQRITDRDERVVFEHEAVGTPVISPQTARTLSDVLTGVVSHGTGTAARIDRPLFGKTGSTDDNADAWFVGATPELATAVWMGDPAARVPMTDVGGRVVFGGTYPAAIWARFTAEALAGAPPAWFPGPDPAQWPPPAFASELGRGPIPAPPARPPAPPRRDEDPPPERDPEPRRERRPRDDD